MGPLHRPISNRLAELNIELPQPPKPAGSYLPVAHVGNLIYLSGQLPMKDGKLLVMGQVPSRCSVEAASAAGQRCVINALAAIRQFDKNLFDRVSGVVRVGVFVSSDINFTQQPTVANGVSDFLVQLFGERGRHVRTAVGSNVLPLDASIEVEFVFWAVDEAHTQS